MEGLIILQKKIKYKINIRKGIYEEISWLIEISHGFRNKLETSLLFNITSKREFNKILEEIIKCITDLNNLPTNIKLKQLSNIYAAIIAIKISKIKFKLMNLISKYGNVELYNITKLYLDSNLLEITNEQAKTNLLQILNKYFNIISCHFYILENDNYIDSINNNNSDFKIGDEVFTKKYKSIILTKLNSFSSSLHLKLYGCKLFIPYKKKLLVLYGFINNQEISLIQSNIFYKNRINNLVSKINNIKLPSTYLAGYIHNLTIRDILLFSDSTIISNCNSKYNSIKQLRNKTLTNIIKDFINLNTEDKRDTISKLLIDSNNNENINLCCILFDLIENKAIKQTDDIIKSLPYYQQNILNESKNNIESFIDTNTSQNTNINYEKKIYMLNTTDDIKQKAIDKLKEIKINKNGESSIKAQQYLDGLLKIPFNIYKYDPILLYLSEFINKIYNFKNKLDPYYKIDLSNLNNIAIVTSFFKQLIKYLITDIDIFREKLLGLKNQQLKNILEHIHLSTSGNKHKLVDKIIENYTKLDCNAIIKFKIFNTKQINNLILDDIISLSDNWKTYIESRKKYINNITNILDKSIYGMEQAKLEIKRIIAQWINGSKDGYVLGFEGPPGTGKTTFASEGLSMCLKDNNGNKRPFIFIALGGSTNGSTLEGHNYTYVGSTWGRIVDSLMESECMNPIIYIDELDKISQTENGKELIGILIHATDSSQNKNFNDKYFSGIKIDISKCLIIFSYNDSSKIDKILLDRIHRIQVKALTRNEKFIVAKKHLIPQICEKVGLNTNDIILSEEIIYYIIDNYTYEAGVRKLKQSLYDICREVNLRSICNNEINFPYTVEKSFLEEIFVDKPKIKIKKINSSPSIGLVNGLYATSLGIGGITNIEAYKCLSDTRLRLELTGSQGDVMKESMKVAKTVAWNLLNKYYKKEIENSNPFGIHIHCPEGAQPKDGPSAGTAITISIISLLTNIPVDNNIAITGEIDLNGNILPIGGLEAKLFGAKKAGVKTVLCPYDNNTELDIIKNKKENPIDEHFKVITVSNIVDVIENILLYDRVKLPDLFNKMNSIQIPININNINSKYLCIINRNDYRIIYYSPSLKSYLGISKDNDIIYFMDFLTNEIKKYIEDLFINKKNDNIYITGSNGIKLYNEFKYKKTDDIYKCNIYIKK